MLFDEVYSAVERLAGVEVFYYGAVFIDEKLAKIPGDASNFPSF
jgi:hypothetical protein